jgi:hypothetical protein
MSDPLAAAIQWRQQSARRAVDAIVVGERHRREMGDIAALADSIEEIGLLHPIVIRPDGMSGDLRALALRLGGEAAPEPAP